MMENSQRINKKLCLKLDSGFGNAICVPKQDGIQSSVISGSCDPRYYTVCPYISS